MADLSAIAASNIKPLAFTASNVVRDAFALALAPQDEYEEGTVAIETLEFASSAVGGLAAAAQPPAAGSVRSSSTVTVPLADSAGGSASAALTVTLYGPGDVRGIDDAQIVRRFPAPGSQTAEESVLAHIEFDRPELPWAFSAAPAGSAAQPTMRPWLTLVVIESADVQWEPATAALLPVMRVPLAQLPPLANAHLWAHAQAPRNDGGDADQKDLSARLSPAHAPVNLSRLISPRVLRDNTSYLAAVVPTTDAGVRGGLGLTGGSLADAWGSSADDPVRLPVYDSWEFRTAPDGDFRSLALKLQGVLAPYAVGRQFIDTSEPGAPLHPLAADAPGRKQVLRCALYSPTPPPTPEATAIETATWSDELVGELRGELDRAAHIEGTAKATDGLPDLPIIGPRIYAKLHRGSAVIEGSDWFAELNLAPTDRIIAGLGTRIVQKDQELLMQSAWGQLGEVEAANRAILLAQLAELLAERMFSRVTALQTGRMLQVTAPMATRVSIQAGSTLAGQQETSATPIAATTSAFRRVTRPEGPLLRRTDVSTQVAAGTLLGADGALRDFTREYRNPDGIGGLTADSVQSFDLELVGLALNQPADAVSHVLASANTSVAASGGFAAYLTTPSRWNAVDTTFDIATETATRWSTRLLRGDGDPALESIRAQRVGPLVAELSLSNAVADSAVRDQLTSTAVTLNDSLLVLLGGGVTGPVVEGPVVHGPVVEGPVVHGPVVEGPVVHGPVVEGPVVHGPVFGGPVVHGPVFGGPVVHGPVFAGPVDEIPVVPGAIAHGLVIRSREQLDAPLTRRSPIGGAIGRLPGGVADVPVVAGGASHRVNIGAVHRTPVGGIGLTQIDVGSMIPLGSADPAVRDIGLKQFADLAEVHLAPTLDRMNQLPLDLLRASVVELVDPGSVLTIDPVPHRDELAVTSAQLRQAIDPRHTVRSALNGRLQLTEVVGARWFAQPRIVPILAAPRFDRTMYKAIEEYDRDWLVPGLGLLPADDFVTVLSTNKEFMEAFLIGLSDEMGRELLWRGYPTDQRGTYFHRFWQPSEDELATPIHAFSRTELSSHISLGGTGERAVIVVKSELVRRFPDLIIEAVKNQGTVQAPVFEKDGSPQQTATVLFAEHLEPDIALVGVDLSIDELDGNGWWILIAEHPSATRFQRRLDDSHDVPADWVHLEDTRPDASAYAGTHLHNPIRVAFEATDLIVRGA